MYEYQIVTLDPDDWSALKKHSISTRSMINNQLESLSSQGWELFYIIDNIHYFRRLRNLPGQILLQEIPELALTS